MKKAQLYDRAEALYVEELRTFEQIATELGCSDRTVRTWAKDGRWETKRGNFQSAQEKLSDDVRDIALLLATKIKGQLVDELEPSPHIINAFTRLAASLMRVRDYDKAIEAETNPEDAGSDNRKVEANVIFKNAFGVDSPLI